MSDNPEPVDVNVEPVAPPPGGADLALPAAARYLSPDDVADIEEQIKWLVRLRQAAVAMTRASQWVDFGGKPYPMGKAAQAIAHAFGLDFDEPVIEWPDLGHGATQCIVHQRVWHRRRERGFTDVGDCDSFDAFLGPRRSDLEQSGATPDQIEKILRVTIRKKAQENAISRAVIGWTGLGGLSWEDLEELGLKREKAAGRVKFRAGTGGGKIPQVSVGELKGLADGSKVRLVAEIVGGEQRKTTKGTAYCNISVTDGTMTAELRYWNEKPGWLVRGVWAVGEVEVGTYRNRQQFTVSHLEEVPAPTGEPDDDSRAAEAIGPRPEPGSASAGTGPEPSGENPGAPAGQLGF